MTTRGATGTSSGKGAVAVRPGILRRGTDMAFELQEYALCFIFFPGANPETSLA